MKKILLITSVVASLSGLSALGQGFFTLTSGGGYAWDNFSTAGTVRSNNMDVAFLFQVGGSASTGPVLAGLAGGLGNNPTNNHAGFSGNPWAAILGDANYHFASNATSGLLIIGTTTAAGGISAAPQNITDQAVIGTSANGGTVNMYSIAWDKNYADPFSAAAANAAVGWSGVLAYAYQSSSVNPTAWGTQWTQSGSIAAGQMGVTAVPEPASFALAGLGAAAMLIFRRRK